MLFFIRKSLKTSLSKALDPEQHGLGELSSRVIMDKKVKLSFHVLRIVMFHIFSLLGRSLWACCSVLGTHRHPVHSKPGHFFAFVFVFVAPLTHYLFAIIGSPLPIRISVISHIMIYIFVMPTPGDKDGLQGHERSHWRDYWREENPRDWWRNPTNISRMYAKKNLQKIEYFLGKRIKEKPMWQLTQ